MPTVGTIVVRTFAYTPGQLRYMYHSSLFSVGGVLVPVGLLFGTLIVTARPGSGVNPFVIYTSKIWGPRTAIIGLLLPTNNTMLNMFGPPVAATVPISIEMVVRNAPSLSQVTFSEVTNLSGPPTTL